MYGAIGYALIACVFNSRGVISLSEFLYTVCMLFNSQLMHDGNRSADSVNGVYTSPAWTKAWNTVKPPNKGHIGELRSYVSL